MSDVERIFGAENLTYQLIRVSLVIVFLPELAGIF
jgi:hypothetical protein